jgi:hypothetical protein
MSEFREGIGDVARDAIGGIGNAYQEILLQDSPLAHSPGLETTDPWPKAASADQPWPGLSGEPLAPEADVSRDPADAMSLESGTLIDADYTELPETLQIEHHPEPDSPDIGR